jgi:hypothetical protein
MSTQAKQTIVSAVPLQGTAQPVLIATPVPHQAVEDPLIPDQVWPVMEDQKVPVEYATVQNFKVLFATFQKQQEAMETQGFLISEMREILTGQAKTIISLEEQVATNTSHSKRVNHTVGEHTKQLRGLQGAAKEGFFKMEQMEEKQPQAGVNIGTVNIVNANGGGGDDMAVMMAALQGNSVRSSTPKPLALGYGEEKTSQKSSPTPTSSYQQDTYKNW